LLDLLQQALARQGLQVSDLTGLASSMHKRDEPALLGLAATLQLPIAWFSADQLADHQGRLSQRNDLCLAVTGSAGVAEACALAQAEALHGTRAQLSCGKIRSANATCALAMAPSVERE